MTPGTADGDYFGGTVVSDKNSCPLEILPTSALSDCSERLSTVSDSQPCDIFFREATKLAHCFCGISSVKLHICSRVDSKSVVPDQEECTSGLPVVALIVFFLQICSFKLSLKMYLLKRINIRLSCS